MPNVTLHLRLADRTLDHWAREPHTAPFDPVDPVTRNAFFGGCFGPDIGYFPGSDPFLSDLAHYVRAGDLTRALVRRAGSDPERAFALGWLTHVLADQAIHPLVGEAAAELRTGKRGGFVGISENRTAHVRVEVGLDALISRRHPELRRRRTTPVFDRRTVRLLRDGYRDTYSLDFDTSLLLASHHAAVRMSNHALATIGVLGEVLTAGPRSAAVRRGRRVLERILTTVRSDFGGESMILAFLNLVRPSRWLVRGVEEIVAGFPERVEAHLAHGLEALPNYNLDTGRVQAVSPGSRCADRTHRRLERMGGWTAATASDDGGRARVGRYRGAAEVPC